MAEEQKGKPQLKSIVTVQFDKHYNEVFLYRKIKGFIKEIPEFNDVLYDITIFDIMSKNVKS